MKNTNFNIWHDIEEDRIHPDDFIAVIEISKNSKNKYELDKTTGMLKLDRVLYTSTHYPANYGFIPKTYAGDDDPLDVLVLSSEEIQPMSLVRCFPIGVIRMIDGDKVDDKIIAVPRKDPNWNHYRDINELPEHLKDEIIHFYQVYKDLEHKKTSLLDIFSANEACNIIEYAMCDYREKFNTDSIININELLEFYQKAELSFSNSNEFERLKALYEKAQSMNRANKTVGFLKGVGRCFKSGYAWALLFAAIGGCMWAISGDFESTTSIVGMFGVVGGMWIAIMTMVNNDNKKKK